MIYFYAIAILSIVAGLCYYIYLLITPKKNQIEKEKERKKDPEIAILIPARNESLVIEDLLDSIEKQTSKINNKNFLTSITNHSILLLNNKKTNKTTKLLPQIL